MSGKRKITLILLLVTALFLAWRLVRPLNIFIVEDKVAYPFETAIPEGLTTLRAEECGSCHGEIYQEWSTSIHSKAWTEEYFQADLQFEDDPPVCKNCHIQLNRQRERKVVGFKDTDRLDPITEPNPHFDPQLRDEGVTCAVCHVRDGVILGPYEIENAPHPVKAAPEMFSGKSPCHLCHLVSGERWDMFWRKPPCGTLEELEEQGEKADCVGCHLPRVTRPMATDGPVRTGGRHLFRGGHDKVMVQSALTVAHEATPGGIKVTLTNSGAGHYLPTGTPDRHLTLELTLKDAAGKVMDDETFTMKRTVMWRPFIIDLWDTRLPSKEPRVFEWDFDAQGAKSLEIVVRYHLLDEARRERIGYQNTTPINYPIYEKSLPLGESLTPPAPPVAAE